MAVPGGRAYIRTKTHQGLYPDIPFQCVLGRLVRVPPYFKAPKHRNRANRDNKVEWARDGIITLLSPGNSEILAKTSQEVDKIYERLDSSSYASEISAVVRLLDTSIENWAETQKRQLKELQTLRKSQEGRQTPDLVSTSADLELPLAG